MKEKEGEKELIETQRISLFFKSRERETPAS